MHESSVDILQELSGAWIGREEGGSDLEIRLNEILVV